VERLVQQRIYSGLSQGAGVIYARRYRVHEGTSGYTTVYEFESTAVPESRGMEGATAAFVPQFPAYAGRAMTHAAGVCRGVHPH